MKDYDYAGNCRTTTKEVTAAASVGMIYYTDGYYSTDYVSTRTPEGVVCKVDSDKKFYIWDIWDQYGYCWGDKGLKTTTNYATGISIYDKLLNSFGKEKMKKKGYGRTQNLNSGSFPSIWTYVLDKNEEAKPANAGVKSEKWFIPSINEMDYVFDNIETMEPTFVKIQNKFGHTSRETIYTNYAYRQVDLLSKNGVYWTSDLHNSRYSGCPVTFYNSSMILYFRDDSRFYGLTERSTTHTYKNETLYMGKTSVNNTSDAGNYVMDRCIRHTNDSKGLDSGWNSWDMNTHAMALVEME